jgi:hypothetical protein
MEARVKTAWLRRRKKMRILKYKVKIIALALFLGIVGLMGEARAQVPKPNVFDGGNRWLITAFDDSSSVHLQWATQGICFLPYGLSGTHIRGVWYSDTYPNWNGRYSQEGDRVLMHGNWGNFIGSDGMVIDLFAGTSPKDMGAGQWTEWFNFGANGTTVVFGNTRLSRVGKCPLPTNADTMTQADFETLSADRSRSVSPRLRKDGKAADHPSDPEQVPLAEETPPQ